MQEKQNKDEYFLRIVSAIKYLPNCHIAITDMTWIELEEFVEELLNMAHLLDFDGELKCKKN